MAVHDEVLQAALRICREKGGWKFRLLEVVRALPHLNPSSVRTHVGSRCCVNARPNHPHRWDYFENVGRGLYEIRPRYRGAGLRKRDPVGRVAAVRERGVRYGGDVTETPRDTVHAVVLRSGEWYVGECLELAVVSQARTLDELVHNMREAVALHLEGEDPASCGVVRSPRLSLTYDVVPSGR